MKRILSFTLACLCALSAHAQLNNLKLQDDQIIWQKVYEDSLSVSDICWILECTGEFESIVPDYDHGTISCYNAAKVIPFAKYGYSHSQMQIFLSGGLFSYHAIIQVKPGRFRVSVTDMSFLDKVNRARTSLEFYAVKDATFAKSFVNGDSPVVIDKYLTDTFDLTYRNSFLYGEW